MKNVLLLAAFAASGCISADAQSMLRVRLADNAVVNVSVDGRYFNRRGTSITVGELPYGPHYVKIYAHANTRRGDQEEVVWQGKVRTYNGMITLFEVDPYTGEKYVKEQDIAEYTHNHPPANEASRFPEQNDQGFRDQRNNTANQNSITQEQEYTPPSHPVASAISSGGVGTLSDIKIDNLKAKVDAKRTDTDKLTVLKDGLRREKITTAQVGDMMDWFSFESTKLDLAKWAYGQVVDKEYYSDLEGKLSYKNYQDELAQFVKEHQ